MPPRHPPRPSPADYEALSEFRYLLRRFLEFSERAAGNAGVTTRQHQALLAIRGFPADQEPTVGAVAERLRIRHHSAVELLDRLAAAGLVSRTADRSDHRRVRIGLTERAEARLEALSLAHLDELERLEPSLKRILELRA